MKKIAFSLGMTLATLVMAPAHAGEATPAAWQGRLAQRFAQADTNHDGHLTLAEAQSGMPRVAQYFDRIDTAHAGYVTLEQLQTAIAAMRR